jgi:hypothetical protein
MDTELFQLAPGLFIAALLLVLVLVLTVILALIGWFHSARTRKLVKRTLVVGLASLILLVVLAVLLRCVFFPFPRL